MCSRTMDIALVFQLIFLFLSILPHSYSQTTGPPISCSHVERSTVSGQSSTGTCGLPSSKGLAKVWKLDLNATFFVNSILVEAITNDSDSVSVDIGTTSCDTFNKVCYVTCSSREVMQRAGCYVNINITCSIPNVKGRYVRVHPNRASELQLCGVRVMGDPGINRGLKNYALKAPCKQGSYVFHYSTLPSYAVDGRQSVSSFNPSCSYSFSYKTMFHWWQVDLGRLIVVSHIIIASSQDTSSYKRLEDFTVELGRFTSTRVTYSLCRHFGGVAAPLTTFNCTQSMWGRYVRVSRTGKSLVLCEVEVYGDMDANSTEVSDLTSNFTWGSVVEYEENATSLETLDDNFNSSSMANITEDNNEPVEMVTAGQTGDFVDEEAKTYCTTCNCQFPVPKSLESVQQEVKETLKELKVPTSEMSQQVRKKTSVHDQRLSSQAVGLICVATISSIFAVIVACDVCHLFHYLLHRKDEYLLTT